MAHLLLIPQGSLFGQIMLLVSFAVFRVHNFYFSSDDRVKIQLREIILPQMQLTRYELRIRRTMVVFVLPMLRPSIPEKLPNTLLSVHNRYGALR